MNGAAPVDYPFDHPFDPANRRLPTVGPDVCWVCRRPRAGHPPGDPSICSCHFAHFRLVAPCPELLRLVGELQTAIIRLHRLEAGQSPIADVLIRDVDAATTRLLDHSTDALLLQLQYQRFEG